MNCPSCSHENRAGAKFCEECATPLKLVCGSCGAELRPTAKFCDECATPVGGGSPAAPTRAEAASAETAGARKVVTILFADLAGSTALHERLDPESARRFMESYYAAARAAVEGHGGVVTQLLGDGVKAVFGVPRVAEDDALRAVRAAVAMQASFRALADAQRGAIGETGLRVAVNTGEVIAKDETEIIGDPVNVAARLQEQGRDGDVVIGQATEQLVGTKVTLEPLGSFTLKGRSVQVRAYRVLSLDAPDEGATAAFVGREAELARIADVYDTARDKPAASLAVVLGSAGLGKSRLIAEFEGRVGDVATVVHADCDEAGGASFAPLADALRESFALDADAEPESVRAALAAALLEDDERERIATGIEALLAARPAAPEETFFVVRRLLAGLAARRPVVLAIDDLQWAEPLLLDLVEHLLQWGSGVPLLLIVGARPELRDVRSSLAVPGGLVSDVVTLTGLDASAATRLAANVIGAADLPAAVAAKVLATSEGNPLFVSELVRMLVHEGALTKEGDRWTTGTALEALEMPPTIHALLAARIERLDPAERTVLEHASIVGRTFSRSAVAALLPRGGTSPDAALEALQRSELIERDAGWLLGEPALRFHHVLIRDAAYGRILKGTRASLHARFGEWVEAQAGASVEHDETIGWHFEQAHRHLGELGPLDAAGRALGERASQRLAAAGRRALERDDVALAASLLGRSLRCLEAQASTRPELTLDWCEALLAAGDVGAAAGAVDELARLAGDSERLRAWHTCFRAQHTVLTAPEALDATAQAVADAATTLAEQDDAAGESHAHYVYALVLQRLGRVGACEAALDRALAAARRVDARRRANTVLAIAPLAALWGPSPVTRASGRCLDVVRVLRITQGAPAVEAIALSCQGVLEALRGRTDAARRMIASARELVEELGITHRLLEADVFAGRVELLDGDAPAAERWLRPAYQGLRDAGFGIDAAQAAALLARALLAQDGIDEAEALSHEAEELAGDDLAAAIAWHGVRAEALARRGEPAAAVELASRAVEIASATDALLDHAEARLAFATALRAAGRAADADGEERRARELWTSKGATVLVPGAERSEPARDPDAAHTPRRVRSNRATASFDAFINAVDARDRAGVEAWYPPDSVIVEHAMGATLGRRELVETWLGVIRSRDVLHRAETVVTLGESLGIAHQRLVLSGQRGKGYEGFGEAEVEKFALLELHPGRPKRLELFAPDGLGHAVARMYELHAEQLPEGPERARAEGMAHSLTEFLGVLDFDRFKTQFAPEVEALDHRTAGFGSLSGREQVVGAVEAMLALTDEFHNRVEDVLATSEHGVVWRWANTGIDRASGGRFERALIELWLFNDAGRVRRWERFEPGQEAAALERFAALEADGDERFENLATRFRHPITESFLAGDARQFEALLAPDLRFFDRRRMAQVELDRAGVVEMTGALLDLDSRNISITPLATRGNRLALWRILVEVAGGDVGPSEIGQLVVVETDERGESASWWARFDADDVDAAYAELDARYTVGEGAAHPLTWACIQEFVRGVASGDWDAIAALCADEFVEYDHQSLATKGTTRGGAAWAEGFRTLAELAPDTAYRVDHFLPAERGFCVVGGWRGTRAGGPYEMPLHAVLELDPSGKAVRADIYDDFDAALGRLAELRDGAEPFANAAARADTALFRCFNTRDWAGVEALAAPDLVFEERRRLARNTCGRDVWLEQFRVMFDLPESRFTSKLLATRGERLSLNLHRFESQVAAGGGPLEMEDHPCLHEVDARGRITAIVLFDLEDLDAAYAELDARFAAGEGAACPTALRSDREWWRAYTERDWEAFPALVAPGFSQHEHRTLVQSREPRDLDGFLALLRSLTELAPDVAWRREHIRVSERAILRRVVLEGSRDGGAFEIHTHAVNELDARGRVLRVDVYDGEDHEAALALFATLASSTALAGPFANAATRAFERGSDAWAAGDVEGFRSLLAPDLRAIDRRFHQELGREDFVANYREMFGLTTSATSREVLATRGDRLALVRMVWRGSGGDVGPSEVDWLLIIETDDQGHHKTVVTFEHPDQLDAAWAELDERFASGEGAAHPQALAVDRAMARAYAEHDWDAFAALAAPGFVQRDRRKLVWSNEGRGFEDFVSMMRSLIDLAPDTTSRADDTRICEGGLLHRSTITGTRDGGPFELVVLNVTELDEQGRTLSWDTYDADDPTPAFARFEELRPDPLRVPVNAATRTFDRWHEAVRSGDAETVAALYRPDYVCEDRRSHAQLRHGALAELSNARWLREGGWRPTRTLLATTGDRLSLLKVVWTSSQAGAASEIEALDLHEVDEEGRFGRVVHFDPSDRAAAEAELFERAVALGETPAPVASYVHAWNDHDLERVRQLLPDFFDDQRRTGVGRLAADDYVDSLRALFELSPDVRLGSLYRVARTPHASLMVNHWLGTNAEGGAVEAVFVSLVRVEDDRISGIELYELEDLERARARFASLGA